MQWIYFLRPTRVAMVVDGPTEQEKETIGRHFAHLSALTDEGVCILVGRTQNNDENTRGICVFNAPDEAAAKSIMESDPAIIHGVMSGELFPFRVALWSNPTG